MGTASVRGDWFFITISNLVLSNNAIWDFEETAGIVHIYYILVIPFSTRNIKCLIYMLMLRFSDLKMLVSILSLLDQLPRHSWTSTSCIPTGVSPLMVSAVFVHNMIKCLHFRRIWFVKHISMKEVRTTLNLTHYNWFFVGLFVLFF